jgi:hypothetical protein
MDSAKHYGQESRHPYALSPTFVGPVDLPIG